MLGGADNLNGVLWFYITGADSCASSEMALPVLIE